MRTGNGSGLFRAGVLLLYGAFVFVFTLLCFGFLGQAESLSVYKQSGGFGWAWGGVLVCVLLTYPINRFLFGIFGDGQSGKALLSGAVFVLLGVLVAGVVSGRVYLSDWRLFIGNDFFPILLAVLIIVGVSAFVGIAMLFASAKPGQSASEVAGIRLSVLLLALGSLRAFSLALLFSETTNIYGLIALFAFVTAELFIKDKRRSGLMPYTLPLNKYFALSWFAAFMLGGGVIYLVGGPANYLFFWIAAAAWFSMLLLPSFYPIKRAATIQKVTA